MPYTPNVGNREDFYLKNYAFFVRTNKFEDFVSLYLMNVYTFNIPVLNFFSHLSKEELLAAARQALLKLLTGIENDNDFADVKKNLNDWKNNENGKYYGTMLSLKDITLVYSAQKLSLQSFIPYYTTDISVATQLINEVEIYYKQVQELAVEVLEEIRDEEQKKRLESEEKYRDLFDNATDLIQIISLEGKIIYVNKAWMTTLGYNEDELKDKVIYDFVKGSEIDNYKNYRQNVITGTKPPLSIRTCYITKQGDEITVEGFVTTKYKDGKPQYTRGMLRNITEKIKQEKKIDFYLDQLAEREKNLLDIIENGPDGVIVINAENKILVWNQKSENIFGWKKDEVIGRNMSNLITPPAMRQDHETGMKRFFQTREPHILNRTIEVPALHRLGHEFYISLTRVDSSSFL